MAQRWFRVLEKPLPEERSKVARGRGKAGAEKRWGDKNKDK